MHLLDSSIADKIEYQSYRQGSEPESLFICVPSSRTKRCMHRRCVDNYISRQINRMCTIGEHTHTTGGASHPSPSSAGCEWQAMKANRSVRRERTLHSLHTTYNVMLVTTAVYPAQPPPLDSCRRTWVQSWEHTSLAPAQPHVFEVRHCTRLPILCSFFVDNQPSRYYVIMYPPRN